MFFVLLCSSGWLLGCSKYSLGVAMVWLGECYSVLFGCYLLRCCLVVVIVVYLVARM